MNLKKIPIRIVSFAFLAMFLFPQSNADAVYPTGFLLQWFGYGEPAVSPQLKASQELKPIIRVPVRFYLDDEAGNRCDTLGPITVGDWVYSLYREEKSRVLRMFTDGKIDLVNSVSNEHFSTSIYDVAWTHGCDYTHHYCVGDQIKSIKSEETLTIVGIFADGSVYAKNLKTGQHVRKLTLMIEMVKEVQLN